MKQTFFAKSFEEDFILKTINKHKKVSSQTIKNILKTKTIKPNTNSFGMKKRLACTVLAKNFHKTYRSQGLIFQTGEKPAFIYPFDISVLTNNNKLITQHYRIENNLHEYYNYELLKGFKSFEFKTVASMLKEFSSPEVSLKKVNAFRTSHKLRELPKQKIKLLSYTEIIFEKPITITPIAVYGYKKEVKELAKKLNIPHARNVKEFIAKNNI